MTATRSPSAQPPLRLLLTPKQAAEALSIGVRTLRYRTADGSIPHVLVGRRVRYCPDDLRAWITRHRRIGRAD